MDFKAIDMSLCVKNIILYYFDDVVQTAKGPLKVICHRL